MQALHKELTNVGFESRQVLLLNDDATEKRLQPYKSNIEKQIELTCSNAERGDLVLIAFSGHGIHAGKVSYLCPRGGPACLKLGAKHKKPQHRTSIKNRALQPNQTSLKVSWACGPRLETSRATPSMKFGGCGVPRSRSPRRGRADEPDVGCVQRSETHHDRYPTERCPPHYRLETVSLTALGGLA